MSDTDKALDIIVRLMDERQDLREQLDRMAGHLSGVQNQLHGCRLDRDRIKEALEVLGISRNDHPAEGIRQLGERIKELEKDRAEAREYFEGQNERIKQLETELANKM